MFTVGQHVYFVFVFSLFGSGTTFAETASQTASGDTLAYANVEARYNQPSKIQRLAMKRCAIRFCEQVLVGEIPEGKTSYEIEACVTEMTGSNTNRARNSILRSYRYNHLFSDDLNGFRSCNLSIAGQEPIQF